MKVYSSFNKFHIKLLPLLEENVTQNRSKLCMNLNIKV